MLAALDQKLRNARKKIKLLYLLEGLCKTFILLALFCVVSFIIDWSLRDIPVYVRLTFLAGGTFIVLVSLLKNLYYPLSRDLSSDELVLIIEKNHPEFKEVLISALQLSRSSGKYGSFNSPELVGKIIERADSESDRIEFSKFISYAEPKKFALAASAILIGMAAFAVLEPANTGIWYSRLFGADTQWPKRTFIESVEISPGSTVARGDDLTVTVKTKGSMPSRASLTQFFDSDNDKDSTLQVKSSGKNQFTFRLERVTDSFSFIVFAGDNQSESHNVTVLPPPEIQQLTIEYEYPQYTGLLPYSDSNGNIKGPVGTIVKVSCRSNIPLSNAELHVGKQTDESVVGMVPIETDGVPSDLIFTGVIAISQSSEYRIRLFAKNGLINRNPVKYVIIAEMDNPPMVKITSPGIDKMVTTAAVIPIISEATDDYGIAGIYITQKISGISELPESRNDYSFESQNLERYGSKRIASKYMLSVATTTAKEGDVIAYQVNVEDNMTSKGHEKEPNKASSRKFHLNVVSRNALEQKMEDLILRIKEDLRRLSVQQVALIKTTEALISDTESMKELPGSAKAAFSNAASDQRKISQGLAKKLSELSDIVADVNMNQLWDLATREKLESVLEIISAIASENSPAAANFISQASIVSELASRSAKLAGASKEENNVRIGLESALEKLNEWEDFQEVVRAVKLLIDKVELIDQKLRQTK